jgi:hypothetical protein
VKLVISFFPLVTRSADLPCCGVNNPESHRVQYVNRVKAKIKCVTTQTKSVKCVRTEVEASDFL